MSSSAQIAYQPWLDGVRALAVAMVLLFHGGVSWMGGGYFGVSVFFTLSGFIMLIAAFGSTSRISPSAFYVRHAKRLLPASLLCLAMVSILAANNAWVGARDPSNGISTLVPGGQLGAVVRRRELRRRAERSLARSLLVAGHRRTVLLDLARLGRWREWRRATSAWSRGCWRLHRRVRSVRPDHRLGVGERRRVLGDPGTCRRDSCSAHLSRC